MKKLLIAALALVVVVVGVALAAPSFIDWNNYRAEIATEVLKATGRKLTIEGDIDAAILPAPQLSVAKVRLANLPGAEAPDMIRLEALDVRVAFWPLLTGRVVVDSVSLRGADVALEVLPDGRANWNFDPPGKPSAGAAGARGGDDSGSAVRLEQVVITNSRVTYRDSRSGAVERIEGIDARLAAETLDGPFALRGRARVRGIGLELDARSGRIDSGRATPVGGELRLIDAKASAKFNGAVTTGTAPRLAMKIDAAGDDLAAAIAAVSGGGTGPALLAREFSLATSITADESNVAANDIALAVNGTRVTGAARAEIGTVTRIDATFGANTLDLDAWLAAAAKTKPAAPPKPAASAPAGSKPAPFALPDDIRLAFDARIGGVTYNKGAVREVGIEARMERGVLTVSRATALLPGGAELTAEGQLRAVDGAPRFDGQLQAKAADARAAMAWLGIDDSAIAPDRLRRVSLRAGLGYRPERLELRDIDLRFDSTRVGGGMVFALRERLGIGANIVVDRINLDTYMAKPKAGAGKKAEDAKGAGNKKGGSPFNAFDANIRAEAGSITVNDLTLAKVTVDGSLIGGKLTLTRLRVGDLAGGRLDVSGTVADLDTLARPDLRFALTTKAPEKVLALAGIELPVAPGKLSPFALSGRLQAGDKETGVDAELKAGALKVSLKGALAGLDGFPNAGVNFSAEHPDFVQFVRLFADDFTPQAAGAGAFSLKGRAQTSGLDVKLTGLEARVGGSRLGGNATLALAGARPKLTADLKGGEITAGHFIPGGGAAARPAAKKGGAPPPGPAPWSDEPLELDGLRAFDADIRIGAEALNWQAWKVANPRIELALADGRLDVTRVSGKTVGGTFLMSGALAAPAKKGGAVELSGELDISRADLARAMFDATALDIAKGTVSFRTNLSGKGASSRALVGSLGGGGELEAVDGAITGFDLGRVNEQLKNLNEPLSFLNLLQTAMSGGTTTFSRLAGTFKIDGGVVRSTDVKLDADGGNGTGSLTVDLPQWTIDALATFRLSGHRDAPPFRMAMTGPLDNPRRVFNLNELQQWLVGRGAGALIDRFINKKKAPSQPAPEKAPDQAQPSKPPAQPQQPKEPKPEEFIQGIFDLLKKK